MTDPVVPRISVILPVFDAQERLDHCLSRLARQSLDQASYEVLVVDNGSNPPLSTRAGNSVNVACLQCETPGSYAARNVGLNAARGEFIAFLDSDCLPDEDWLESGLLAVGSSPPGTLLGGEVLFLHRPDESTVERFQKVITRGQAYNISKLGFSVTANLFGRRQDMLQVGLFIESLLSGGDREWCWRAWSQGMSIQHLPSAKVTTSYRQTISQLITRTRRFAGGAHALEKMGCAPPDWAAEPSRRKGNAVARMWRLTGGQGFGFSERVRVVLLAAALKVIEKVERMRLVAGGRPERR